MEELDVEPVDRIEDVPAPTGVVGPEYVLYGGKGGVGKTTMAAATGVASARDGTTTLVVSTDPAHSLSDIFEEPIPDEPTRLRSEDPLYAVEIDPESVTGPFDSVAGAATPDDGAPAGLGGLLDEDHPLLGGLDGSMPGADEAAALHQLMRYLDDDRFDRIIVDTAPTGHTLRLLELPELMDSMVGRMMKFRQRLEEMLSGFSNIFGEDTDESGMAQSEQWAHLQEQLARLRVTLQDPDRTDFRIVMVPETMSIDESKRLKARVTDYGIPVSTVVVNRIMEDVADIVGREIEGVVGPAIEECAFCRRRWQVQQSALEAAQPLFHGTEIKRVPLFADEVRGETYLRAVAACLE